MTTAHVPSPADAARGRATAAENRRNRKAAERDHKLQTLNLVKDEQRMAFAAYERKLAWAGRATSIEEIDTRYREVDLAFDRFQRLKVRRNQLERELRG